MKRFNVWLGALMSLGVFDSVASTHMEIEYCDLRAEYAMSLSDTQVRVCTDVSMATVDVTRQIPLEVIYDITLTDIYQLPRYRNEDIYHRYDEHIMALSGQAIESKRDVAHLVNEKIPRLSEAAWHPAMRVLMSPRLNRKGGPWHQLEEKEVNWGQKRKHLIVVAGTDISQKRFYKLYIHRLAPASIAYMMETEAQQPVITSGYCLQEQFQRQILHALSYDMRHLLLSGKAFSEAIWSQGTKKYEGCK